jgi:hypothetical protein
MTMPNDEWLTEDEGIYGEDGDLESGIDGTLESEGNDDYPQDTPLYENYYGGE